MASPHILYAHREDDITTLLDVIGLQDAQDVCVVIPEHAAIFQDLLNVKLLHRECVKIGKTLTISTQDSVGAALAKKAGIPVETPRDAEKFFEGWEEKSKIKDQKSKTQIKNIKSEETPSLITSSSMPQNQTPSSTTNPAPRRKRGMDIVARAPRSLGEVGHVSRSLEAGVRKRLPADQKPPTSPQPQKEPEVAAAQSPSLLSEADMSGMSTEVSVKKSPTRQKKSKAETAKAEGIVPMAEMEESGASAAAGDFFAGATEAASVRPGRLEKRNLVPFVIIGALVAVAAALFFLVKPSATITIHPKEETVEFEMDISGRTDISSAQADKAIIPLERLRVDDTATKEFPASGNRDVQSKAHGRITVYNNFSAASQAIVATTRFLSESGKLFRTPNPVVIPGTKMEGGKTVPGSIEIEIVADQAGEEYNIPPSRFSIPGFTGTPKEKAFWATSLDAMGGGFKGQSHVVEKKDIEDARESLVPSEKARLEEALRKKFPPDLRFIDGALAVSTSEVIAKPGEGEPGEKFTLSMRTVAEALLFREQDVLDILEPNIASHLAAQYVTLPETRKISYTVKQFDSTLGRLAFTVLVSVKTRVVVDEKELAQKMAGMDVGETKAFFTQQNQIERADLSLWPFWARHLPKDPARIRIITGKK